MLSSSIRRGLPRVRTPNATFHILRSVSTTKLYIDGQFVESKTTEWIDLHDPATNELVTKVPKATKEEMQQAVDAAKKAFRSWNQTSILTRQQCMFRYQQLIKDNMKSLAANITKEQGKTLVDAEGDVFRGLQVVEQACGIPSLTQGESQTGIAKDMDIISFRLPLGVCGGITPFNFPAMIPLWMFPLAITVGNTFVIKPSERDPGACMMLVDLLKKAGVPDGVVNVIHGQHDAVNFVCDNPEIKAVSFVGSDQAGKYIYERASKAGKRVQVCPFRGFLYVSMDLTFTLLVQYGSQKSWNCDARREQGAHP